jgi:hypothetical protein
MRSEELTEPEAVARQKVAPTVAMIEYFMMQVKVVSKAFASQGTRDR